MERLGECGMVADLCAWRAPTQESYESQERPGGAHREVVDLSVWRAATQGSCESQKRSEGMRHQLVNITRAAQGTWAHESREKGPWEHV